MRLRIGGILPLALCLAAAPLEGQDPAERTRELEKKLQELQERVDAIAASADLEPRRAIEQLRREMDALTKEMETLRSGVPEKRAEPAAPDATGPAPGFGPAASKVYRSERGVSIGGYGEILYENFAARRGDGAPSDLRDRIDLLRAVFYFGYKFDDRFLFNSEVEYEHASTGEGSETKGEVSVEFAYLDYLLGKKRATGLRAGLVLVPVGFVNELHEPPVFLGARRPEIETLILPTTWSELGAGVFGQAGPVSYRAYVVNGLDAAGFTGAEAIRGGRQAGSHALAENFAVTGRLDYLGMSGLLAGVSGYWGGSGQGREVEGRRLSGRVSLFDAHAEWRWRGIAARALFARGSIGDAARINALNGLEGRESVPRVFAGGYVEAGYDVLSPRGGAQALVAFVRYERFDTQLEVPAGFSRDPANDVRLWTVGVSYRPIPQIVLKTDYQDFNDRAKASTDRWNV
ncbi:MAG: hypothetical protein M3R34_01240, partial [Acidobacteriota bacterium]|nr:hypothetical protein [Acidobacteriota bacterium]